MHNYEIFPLKSASIKSYLSSLWFNNCFRDVLCQREDDNMFIVNGKIS